MKFYAQVLFALSMALLSLPIYASDIMGLFSSFKLSEDSGDIVGMEVHIVPTPTGYAAVVQGAEGAPGFPEVFEIGREGELVIFTVPADSASGLRAGRYTGRVSAEGLLLNGPSSRHGLKRKASYWR